MSAPSWRTLLILGANSACQSGDGLASDKLRRRANMASVRHCYGFLCLGRRWKGFANIMSALVGELYWILGANSACQSGDGLASDKLRRRVRQASVRTLLWILCLGRRWKSFANMCQLLHFPLR
ncbi:hypothetical protein CEXT_570171 [Caerostris extrusa]|uniref:Secreted protein n=1 Tax=Caerostris extrusa TaxID=172846 RepID=A0AAV4RRX9_CAEEX|nr:hypothetical protein CEXT_570171 [Caerostris extrusa]